MKKIYLVALICAIMAGVATYLFAQTLIDTNDPNKGKTQIIYAQTDVPAGTQITSNNVDTYFTVKTVDEADVTAGAVKTVDELLGQTTSGYIYAGEQVIAKRFGTEMEENAGLSYNLQDGHVAYSLSAEGTMGVDGYILTGDTVDVLAVKTVGEKQEIETVLSDVKVLKISTNDLNADVANPILTYSSITLELTYDEAETMFTVENTTAYGGTYKIILKQRTTETEEEE